MTKENTLKKWLVFGVVAVGIFMSTLDGSIVNIALPSMLHDFDVSLSTIKWVPVVYLLTISCMLLAFGRLSDMIGRRRVYIGGLMVFSTGSLFCGLSPSAEWLITSRCFQGIGAAMIMACTPALIVDNFGPEERGKALGMIGAVVASGLTLGPAVGGLILEHLSWQWIFFINLPIGLFAVTAASRILVKTKGKSSQESFDWAGAVLMAICFAGFILGLSQGKELGWTSTGALGLLTLCAVSAVAFMIVESRAAHPLVDQSLFSIRLFATALAAAIALFISLFALVFLMPFYLKYPGGFSDAAAGGILVTPFVFLLAGSPVFGSLFDKWGSRLLCTVGMIVLSIALFSFATMPPTQEFLPIFWRLALAGLGTSIFTSPNSAAAMTAVPAPRRGIAAALVATARNMGMMLGIAIAGTLFSTTFEAQSHGQLLSAYDSSMEAGFMAAFHRAMFWSGVVAAIGAILAALRGKPLQK